MCSREKQGPTVSTMGHWHRLTKDPPRVARSLGPELQRPPRDAGNDTAYRRQGTN